MTANEISDVIIRNMADKQFPIFLTTFAGIGISEADVFGINRNGYMYEYEIKRSRGDFFNEFRNKDDKHRRLKKRDAIHIYDEWKYGKRTGCTYEAILIPNRYFFACEPGLIKAEEVPEYSGLVYIDKIGITEQKCAPLLHKHKANQAIYERVANVLSQRIIYGCSFYTFKHNQKLQSI